MPYRCCHFCSRSERWPHTSALRAFFPPSPSNPFKLEDTLERQLSAQYTGNPLSSAGDVNGDGFGDILVGSPGAEGRTYLVFGGVDLPAAVNLLASDDTFGGSEGVVVFKGASSGEITG